MRFEEGKRFIEKLREEKIKEMFETGKRWMVTKERIPMFQLTTESVRKTLCHVKDLSPETLLVIAVHDLIESKEYSAEEFLMKYPCKEEKEEPIKEVSFIEDTESVGKQRFLFNSEADAEICVVVMSQMMTGEHRFTSPINYTEKGLFRVRGVLRPRDKKYGTPQVMNMKDTENAWLLQQIFSWCLEGTLRITSVKQKENWVDVVWEKIELPVPEKEWKIYKVEEKRIDGRSWRITGEKK